MKFSRTEKILLIIISVLIFLILTGTIAGLIKKGINKKENTPEVLISKGKAVNLAEPVNTDIVTYYQTGTFRTLVQPDPDAETGTVMVVTPWIAYPEGDSVFYEEIARKKVLIKGIFTNYFSEKTMSEILSLGESRIVSELLSEINSNLSLGQISDIYFTDFIFL